LAASHPELFSTLAIAEDQVGFDTSRYLVFLRSNNDRSACMFNAAAVILVSSLPLLMQLLRIIDIVCQSSSDAARISGMSATSLRHDSPTSSSSMSSSANQSPALPTFASSRGIGAVNAPGRPPSDNNSSKSAVASSTTAPPSKDVKPVSTMGISSIRSSNNGATAAPMAARALISDIGNLQHVGPRVLEAAKAKMDVLFDANRLKPTDEEYVYDKRVDFPPPKETSEWDD
jgi:hypothetical protein